MTLQELFKARKETVDTETKEFLKSFFEKINKTILCAIEKSTATCNDFYFRFYFDENESICENNFLSMHHCDIACWTDITYSDYLIMRNIITNYDNSYSNFFSKLFEEQGIVFRLSDCFPHDCSIGDCTVFSVHIKD